jgi:hypothetical protein
MADLEVSDPIVMDKVINMLIPKSAISLSDSGSARDALEVRPITSLEQYFH